MRTELSPPRLLDACLDPTSAFEEKQQHLHQQQQQQYQQHHQQQQERRKKKAGFRSPDRYASLLDMIKSCRERKDLRGAFELHTDLLLLGAPNPKDMDMLGNALVRLYGRCGAIQEAKKVFDAIHVRNVASWNLLISAYNNVQEREEEEDGGRLGHEAIRCFREMQGEGISPNAHTYACVLKACSRTGSLAVGEEICSEAERLGLVSTDIVLATSIIDMHAKCGSIEKAQQVFDSLPARDTIAWSALISGYIRHGRGDRALDCFRKMQDEDRLPPDAIAFVCILKACASIGSLEVGEEIHAQASRSGLLRTNAMLGTTLVDMYVKCGMLEKAQRAFDGLPSRTIVSWNALITGYAMHGLGDEAFACFERMLDDGLTADAITFMALLKACCSIRCLGIGEEIHNEARKLGLLEKDFVLGTSLVDMYAKFGELEKAQEVFDGLPVWNITSWTALMSGYAQLGQARKVFYLFGEMIAQGIAPDQVMFLVLLTSCSHSGLIQEGQMIFGKLRSIYCFAPALEHYISMIDLFSRAGQFEKAVLMIGNISPSTEQVLLWLVLLGACLKWLNVDLGRWTFERLIRLDEKCAQAYICMANIYAAVGLHAKANEIEAWRVNNGASHASSDYCLWTDVDSNLYTIE